MKDENESIDELEDKDEFANRPYINEIMYKAISPKIKQYLLEYFGASFYTLQPETYLGIDAIIKENLYDIDYVTTIIYLNRTILDLEEYDEAQEKFIPPSTPRVWKEYKYYFHEDSLIKKAPDKFLKYKDPNDLTETQKEVKKLFDAIDDYSFAYENFKVFIRGAYEILIVEFHLVIESQVSFGLEFLSPKGFEELQRHLHVLIEDLFRALNKLILEDLYTNSE